MSPSVLVALRPLFVRVRQYATQLTAASRPYPPQKITHILICACKLHVLNSVQYVVT